MTYDPYSDWVKAAAPRAEIMPGLKNGPTIILAHAVTSQLTFYTFYGHLSRDSLYGLTIGEPVTAGVEIARLGEAAVNGDWPPHLHFQLILDMQGRRGDYPGVFKKSEREQWKRICPDI